jgi:hypothetical protein
MIGASMGDAARTREDEGPCICDNCPLADLQECNKTAAICEGELAEQAADEWREAVRDQ